MAGTAGTIARRLRSAALAAGLALAVARPLVAADPPAPAAGPDPVEERLKAIEALNARLLSRYEGLARQAESDRRAADERYRSLEARYEKLRQDRDARPAPEVPASELPRLPIGVAPVEGEAAEGAGRPGDQGAEEASSPEPLDEPSWPLGTRYQEGFTLHSADDELQLRFRVLNQVDFKDFVPNDLFPARSGLYIPRTRVYFEGQVSRSLEYEVSIQRSVEGVWDLLDGNINIRPSEAFQVQFGRMLVPYSYDWYDHLEQYFITPERGLFPLNFGLSRSAGLMAHGLVLDDRLQYAVGGFDGRLAGVADNNTTRDAVGYLNARPFLRGDRFPALRYLNLGGSIFVGLQNIAAEPLPLRTSLQSSENDEAASAASATFLTYNEGVAAFGDRAAGALHLAYYRGGLSVEAEYQAGRFGLARFDEHGRRVAGASVPVTGYHITTGYFLTGEEVQRRSTVVPLRPFRIRPGEFSPGAVELFARFSELAVSREVFTGGFSDPEESSRDARMVDVGFNWYWNRYVKWYVDWQLPYFGSPVLVNEIDGLKRSSAPLFWVRCQVYF
jgi:phosphate-selective porin OprO/OprP